jgi:N-methylhydantoinase B
MNATIAMNDGDTHNGPSEQVEAKYPLLVERYALRPDSGGAGTFRGGLGTEQVVQARADIRFNAQIDRVKCRPWGLFGGLPAAGNGVAVHRFGEDEHNYPSGKAFNLVLHSGDAYILRSGGGGGFGSPLDRDLDALENDVAQGYVTRDAAEQRYGAVFAGDGPALDRPATERRRADMRAQGLPVPEPDEPASAGDHHGHRHDHAAAHQNLTEEERLVMALSNRCCS